MSAAGRRIWREIVASKPIDWFEAGSLHILRHHAENVASADRVSRQLARVKVGTTEFRELTGDARRLGAAIATSARQLRLTVQHSIDRRDQKAGERGAMRDPDADLIGGRALRNGLN